MSKRSDEEYMSAEELRNRLYHSLRDKGLVNSMKSQLRTSLVSELKQSVKGKLSIEDLEVPESGSLVHRASNTLVADHLMSCKYDYTHSVFIPECGLDKAKMLSISDVLQLLKISPQSRLFKKMTVEQPQKSKKGFLWQLLGEICSLHSQPSQTISTQTDLIKVATVSTLDEKMSVLDELFSSRREEQYKTGATALEDRLLKFQRQLEERFKQEFKLEVAKVKDDEVAKIRLEEKENFRREIDKARKDLERTYQHKYDALVVRERHSTERLQREQDMQEREIYNQRQSILEEIEAVRQRETSVKREIDVFAREKKLEKERTKAVEQDLRRRELEIERKEREFHQRLENEMTKFKVEYQAKFLERSQNIEIREATLRENERRVGEDQGKLDQIKCDLRDKTQRVNELETLLQEARHKEVDATKHNEFLNAKLRDMADYASIKDQNITYRTELENLKTRMAEIIQLNERERIRQEELLREIRRPTAIPDYINKEDGSRYDRAMYEHGNMQGTRRYYEQTDRNDTLVRQFEAQTLQMKEMNQELTDLRQTLGYTQKALSNEVYRRPQDADGSRLVSFNLSPRSGRGAMPSDNDSDNDYSSKGGRSRGRRSKSSRIISDSNRDDVYNDIDLSEVSAPKISTDFTTDESSNQSADIIAETKYRLKSLEKEAKNLERAYVDFHYQVTNPSSMPDPGRHSLRKSQSGHDQQGSRGQRIASPTASPIASRPMSSTPYQQPLTGSQAEADLSTDSLQELKGSSSYNRQKVAGQDPVPKFSLSDVSDDELDKGREKVERPRPITVDDLEARPGSPSIMVVQADPSSDGGNTSSAHKESVTKQVEVSEDVSRPPAKLPPIALDDAWKMPSLDDAWKTEEKPASKEDEGESWAIKQKRKADERERQEAREREEQEAREREEEARKMEMEQKTVSSGKDTARDEASERSDGIDPVMKQYMALVQKNKEGGQPQEVDEVSDKIPSQIGEELSLTEEVKSEEEEESQDDFNW